MRKCRAKGCTERFQPKNSMHCACSPKCALAIATAKRERSEAAKAHQTRQMDRQAREAIKPRGEWLQEAQQAFNAWIRHRDRDMPCISCGRNHNGQWHAGHYLSTGARPELRFDPMNVHKQCQPCNTHLHGNLIMYRVNLIARIGQAEVDRLEGPHAPKKYSAEALKEIRNSYRKLLREEQKEVVA